MKVLNTYKNIRITVCLIGLIQILFVIDGDFITLVRAVFSYTLLLILFNVNKKIKNKDNFEMSIFIKIYLFCGVIGILRGFFEVENYWDWKQLLFESSLVLLLPLISFIGSIKKASQFIFSCLFFLVLPFFPLVFLAAQTSQFNNTDGLGRFLSPIYLFILFIPWMKRNYVIIIILLALCSFFSDLDARSNLIRITVSFLLMFIVYCPKFIRNRIVNILHIILFVAPLFFFILAITNTFNIFQMDEYISGDYTIQKKSTDGTLEESNLIADTRTLLYQEVIASSINNNTWLFGESAVAGYKTVVFESVNYGSKGRQGVEVGILMLFLYMGLTGIIAYSLIFYFASYLCIKKSKNLFCKILGAFVAFRWAYSWVEEFTNFDMNYFFLWLSIGMCFSKQFRAMSDTEIQIWIKGIFNKKYMINKLFPPKKIYKEIAPS